MFDLIQNCSDIFYDSLDRVLVDFRVILGFSFFVVFVFMTVFFVLGFLIFIFETLKKKLISRKQRKADKDV